MERFPDLVHEIASGNSSDLGFHLRERLVAALQAADYPRAREVVAFVHWLARHPFPMGPFMQSDILREAVRRVPLRSELWKAMSLDEFNAMTLTFCEILEADVSRELEREFRFTVR
jgi:hypothetical protein